MRIYQTHICRLQLMKVWVLAESSFIFSPDSLCYAVLLKQLIKALVLAEAPLSFHQILYTMLMSTGVESGRCPTLPNIFYHFTFPGFPFTLIG